MFEIESTPEIDTLLAAGSPVAIGVSGGKDSCALGLALNEHLDRIGHAGARVLIHSDLGRVEWADSLPACERLAEATGLDLVVVRRQAGDMMDRWLTRWENNVERYRTLRCVQLILPWSTPSMRFCTSELKTDVICRELIRRFPGQTILSASGIRRDESSNRAKSPITKRQAKLDSRKHATNGLDWHPILGWSLDDVFGYCQARGFAMHEAYTRYGASRVSCAYCIMSAQEDLRAAASCEDNHDLYREMVGLEIASSFAFQGGKWLGDTAPHLLDASALNGLARAKETARVRQEAEAGIPRHLLYTDGWPTVMPTQEEAELLATIRATVAGACGIAAEYLDADSILGRYAELMEMKAQKRGTATLALA